MIATALRVGIGKKELFEDYYFDELPGVIAAYADMMNPKAKEEREKEAPPKPVGVLEFLGPGGEIL